MENPMKLDDLEVPLFLETPFYVKLLEGYVSQTASPSNQMQPKKHDAQKQPCATDLQVACFTQGLEAYWKIGQRGANSFKSE